MAASLGAAALISGACAPDADTPPPEPSLASPEPSEAESPARIVEGKGLLGQTLYRIELPDAARQKQEAFLEEAQARLDEHPEEVDAWIWVGRRTAYLGRYQDAIATYSKALEQEGWDDQAKARLLRHRGHRYLSLRQLDEAAQDFEQAASLVEGQPDRVEEDGLPNARNQPTSTLGTNIWYHLGLVRYLQADWQAATEAYEQCWELSKNPDMQSATAYWLYMTLRHLDRETDAEELLGKIHRDMDIIENRAYHDLLTAFQGNADLAALLSAAQTEGDAALATTGYGVGMGYQLNGDPEAAREVWNQVVETSAWSSFGFIAAEAELLRFQEGASGS